MCQLQKLNKDHVDEKMIMLERAKSQKSFHMCIDEQRLCHKDNMITKQAAM